MLELGLGINSASLNAPAYTTFRTWDNDASIVGTNGFQPFSWDGTAPTVSFEASALDGETNYGKLLVNQTQTFDCMWRDNNLLDDDNNTINFPSNFTRYRVQAKLYASLDSSRTEITISTSFGLTSQNRFSTTLQNETWTTIDVSGNLVGAVGGSHLYLYDWDQSGNFPIAGEFYALKDVTLSLG